MKKFFFLFANVFFIILSIIVASLTQPDVFLNPLRKISQNYQHHNQITQTIDHYTLPFSMKTNKTIPFQVENNISSTFSDIYQSFHQQNRGLINCQHFEAELSCNDIEFAVSLWNETLSSQRFLYIDCPKTASFQEEINTMASGFLLSILTKRRLFLKRNIQIPGLIQSFPHVSVLPKTNISYFYSKQINRCNFQKILENHEVSLVLSGVFDPVDLLLDPIIFEKLKYPFNTHFIYLMSKFLFHFDQNILNSITFPPQQLQIGISLEFDPNWSVLFNELTELTEGYSSYALHILNPKGLRIPTYKLNKLSNNLGLDCDIKIYKKFDESSLLLISCDHFIGSLGFFLSHFLNNLRGRGGHYINSIDSKLFEAQSSQSGFFFEKEQSANLLTRICPNGMKAFQYLSSFLLF